MRVRPFEINVPEERLQWIRRRVADTAWPDIPVPADGNTADWSWGTNADALRELLDHWQHSYDWRHREALLNHPQHIVVDTEVDGDPYTIHAIHVIGKGPRPRPVILSHGWPGSFVEFMDVIDRLTDPAAFGGRKEDAMTVVIPSLPGFGFSSKPKRPIGPRTIARAFDQLMAELGYHHYVAQGGDWGAAVSGWLGYEGPGCCAIHINLAHGWTRPDAVPETDEELAEAKRFMETWQKESGYFWIQSTKPLTLSYAMADSPVGVAAWILEKFQRWSDIPDGNIWNTHTRDKILDNIMVYLVTNSFGTASWIYRGVLDEPVPAGTRIEKPVGFANYPGEISQPVRSMVEKSYNIQYWSDLPHGGHFAAMEQPDIFARDLQAFVRQL